MNHSPDTAPENPESTPILEAKDLHFAFGKFPVLKGISFTLKRGEVACLTGENGCGKSTALKLLVGNLKPSSGEALLFGSPSHLGKELRRVGFVPQATTTEKISFPITSRELVVQGLGRDFGLIKVPRKKHYEQAEEILERLGLGAFITVPFAELSGGLQQRVLIARALINDPDLLILDEPISGVDAQSRVEFLSLIERLRVDRNLTVLIVTHDLDEIRKHVSVNTIYRIKEGVLSDATDVL